MQTVLGCIIKQTSCASVKVVKMDAIDASSNGVASDDWLGSAMGFVGGGSRSAGAFVCVLEGRAHGVRQDCPNAK